MTISTIRCLMMSPISKISTQTTTDVVDHHIHVSEMHANMTNMHDSYIVHARYASVIHTSLSLQQKKQQTSTRQLPPQEFRMVSVVFHPRAEKRTACADHQYDSLCSRQQFARVWGLCFLRTPPIRWLMKSPLSNQIDPRKKTTNNGQSHKAFIYIILHIYIAP